MVGNACASRIATFHHATLRVAPHRYATREPLGTPSDSRAFSTDGPPSRALWLWTDPEADHAPALAIAR